MMWGYGCNWLNMTMMMLGLTIWLALLALLVWAGIRWLNRHMTDPTRQRYTPPEGGPNAREILSKRYAQGEIDATTFEQMRETLEGTDNRHQKNWAEVHRTVGESLFDGRVSGPEI